MKGKIKITNLLFFLLILSCNSIFKKRIEFENDFQNHTLNSDSVLFDGDLLHPKYAFMKNGKITGIEFNGNPECGKFIRRYFLNENEKIEKIILDVDFYSENCGKPFDSIYLIKPNENKVEVYTKITSGKEINAKNYIENYAIDIADFKEKLKKWQNR